MDSFAHIHVTPTAAEQPERKRKRLRVAGGIEDEIGAASAKMLLYDGFGRDRGGVESGVHAQTHAQLSPARQRITRDNAACAGKAAGLRHQLPNRAQPQYNDTALPRDLRLVERMHGDSGRLDERGGREREVVRQRNQIGGRHAHEFRKRAGPLRARTDTQLTFAHVRQAGKAVRTFATVHARIDGDPIPSGDACHSRAQRHNHARKLVAEHHRRFNEALIAIDVQIGAANADPLNPEHHLMCAG